MIGFVDTQTLLIKLYHKCPKYSIVLMRLANKNIEAMRKKKAPDIGSVVIYSLHR